MDIDAETQQVLSLKF